MRRTGRFAAASMRDGGAPARRQGKDGRRRFARALGARRNAGADRNAAGGARGAGEIHCAFGATRVAALLGRLRMHLATDRFLAVLRGDSVWRAGCERAARTLDRLAAELPHGALGARLSPVRRTRSGGCVRRMAAPRGCPFAAARSAQ